MPHPSEAMVHAALTESGCALGCPTSQPWSPDPARYGETPFVDLHDQLLERMDGDELQPWPADHFQIEPALASTAAEIINQFSGIDRPWGWVDPRATLFLEFWDDLLPDARWIFLFCRPSLFAWSLMADDRLREHSRGPVGQAFAAFSAWRWYSDKLQAFIADRPDRTFLLEVPAGLPRAAPLLDAALPKWGYALAPLNAAPLRQPFMHIERAPKWVRRCEAASASTRRAWRSLRDLALDRQSSGGAALGRPPPSAPGVGGPRVCVAGWNRDQYSQTFVLAHIGRLPAQTSVLVKRSGRLVTSDEFPLGGMLERASAALMKEFRADPRPVLDRSLARFLRRERVDAVLAEFGTNGAAVWRACRRADVPLVVHFHGFDAHASETLEEHGAEYVTMFENVAAVVVVSREMGRRLVEMGADPDRVHLNPCGVDVSDFSPADPGSTPPTFLAVGRFVNKKGPLLTILAFRAVLDEVPEARLLMVGEGILLDGARQIVDGLGLGGNIHFLGSRPHREVAHLMQGVRGFVQHSLVAENGDAEGTPVAVLEAGATGIPVVATKHTGIADAVVHGETGYLVAERDVSAMSRYLTELARDPELASRLGARAREYVSNHHSMAAHLERLWAVIERAIETRGAAEAPSGGRS